MSKDPAVLLYIDNWLVSTKDMKGAEKGWYLNLLLYQYDKGDLPNDIEELANLCDVRISEYENFKQVFKQVLKQKFELNENGRLENPKAREIIRKRETFKEKRSDSGKLGYIIKVATNELKATSEQCEYIKDNIKLDEINTKNKQMLIQVLKQIIKLYINGDGAIIVHKNINYNILVEKFNEYCSKMSKILSLTDIRKSHINARVEEHDFDTIINVFKIAGESDFLNGVNDKQWKATFDWLMKPTNFVKVLEGNYNNKERLQMMT